MKGIILVCAFVGICSLKPTPDVVSVQSGNWDDATTWSPAIVPDSTKIVEVSAGHVVTLRSDVSCKDLVLHGTNAFSGNYKIYIKGN